MSSESSLRSEKMFDGGIGREGGGGGGTLGRRCLRLAPKDLTASPISSEENCLPIVGGFGGLELIVDRDKGADGWAGLLV